MFDTSYMRGHINICSKNLKNPLLYMIKISTIVTFGKTSNRKAVIQLISFSRKKILMNNDNDNDKLLQ